MGKGSGRRPAQVADDVVAENWRKAFRNSEDVLTETRALETRYYPSECAKCGGTGLITEYDGDEPRVLPCDRC